MSPPRAPEATPGASPAGRPAGRVVVEAGRAATGGAAGLRTVIRPGPPFDPGDVSTWVVGLADAFDRDRQHGPARVLRVAAGMVLAARPEPGPSPVERPTSCATCSGALPPARPVGRPRRYCGRRCRDAARSRAEPRAKLAGAIVAA